MCIRKSFSSLEDVLGYQNDRLLQKFRTLFDVSADESNNLFNEVKKWLWICMKRKYDQRNGDISEESRPLVIHMGMVILDELWHTFILHTKEYQEFCLKYFGEMIHHSPGYPGFKPLTEEEMTEQVEYIWDKLGEETVDLWYSKYPEIYSEERLHELLKPRIFGRPCEAV